MTDTQAVLPTASPELDGLAVSTRRVRRVFGDREVLRGLDVDVRAGEFVALLGRSGSGKSTFLRALAGLDDAAEGTIFVPAERSVVFQDPRLLPWASVLDNVILGLDAGDRVQAGREALAEVELTGHAGDWPKTLSGGEAQRVALARALVRSPDLLLLDEPFGALDALTRIRMHALVQRLCARHHPAVLLVTHDVDEAVLLADRVLVLVDGVISLDLPVDVPSPRLRGDQAFIDLRSLLLSELGVDEAAEGARSGPTATATPAGTPAVPIRPDQPSTPDRHPSSEKPR